MTDYEYIEAFCCNNERAITKAYEQMRKPVLSYLKNKLKKDVLQDDDFEEIYQDAFVRMFQNIQKKRISADTLTVPLVAYLKGISMNVAYEVIRSQKDELISDDIWELILNGKRGNIKNTSDEDYLNALWYIEVESVFYSWRSLNPQASYEELALKFQQLTDKYYENTKSSKIPCLDYVDGEDPLSYVISKERNKLIMAELDSLGYPCSSILKYSFYDNLSLKEITEKMFYKSTDVTKNLKSRCLKGLKEKITKMLNSVGYEYR